MKVSSDIKPVSYLKSHTAEILKQINETHRPIVITQNGEPKGVLQDPETYDSMKKAIGILKLITQGEENVKEGKFKPQERVLSNIEKMLEKKSKWDINTLQAATTSSFSESPAIAYPSRTLIAVLKCSLLFGQAASRSFVMNPINLLSRLSSFLFSLITFK